MNNRIYGLLLILIFNVSFINPPENFTYQNGEFLKYRVSYSIFSAAYATLRVSEEMYQNKPHFRVVGQGKSSGALSLFCKIEDRYETFIDKETGKPSKFIRKISECGHTKDIEQQFDFEKKEVLVINKEDKKRSLHKITDSIQDLISAFYKLRSYNTNLLKNGEFISLDIFLDEQIYPFKLKILNRETVKTKFGKIKAIKIAPYVQNGRIFKAQESVTAWISDSPSHVPLLIEAELRVGTLKVSLDQYENLKFPIK